MHMNPSVHISAIPDHLTDPANHIAEQVCVRREA